MDKELRVLIVEDSAADAELLTKELGKGGLVHTSKRVESKDDFIKALGEYKPGIILCDYRMPGFSAPEALEIVKTSSPETPFIVVSGTIGEDTAVEMMKSGVTDYVMKDRISRLVPAVKRAFKENEERAECKKAEEKLISFQRALESASDAIGISTPDGRHVYQNEAFTKLFGLSVEEVDGALGPAATVYADEKVGREVFDTIMRGDTWAGEVKMLVKDRIEKDIFLRAYSTKDKEGRIVDLVGVHTDITERKKEERAFRDLSFRQQAILAAIPEIVVEVDKNKVFTWTNQAGFEFYGADVIGKEAAFYFEGVQDTYRIVAPIFGGSEDVVYVESWQRRKDGEKRLLAWWCRVLKDGGGNVIGAISSSRDITERKKAEEEARKRMQELEIFYKASVGREERIIELKKEVAQLKAKLGKTP